MNRSESECGVVMGRHLCNKSAFETTSLQDIQQTLIINELLQSGSI